MTTAVAVRENYSALDASIGNDVDDAQPLRFKEGAYYAGFDKVEVEMGTVFRVHPMSVQDGFVKWLDGKPVDTRMREWCRPDQPPINRNDLDYLDEASWPDGKDPWAFTMILAFKDANGEMFKFTTSTAGGSNAIKKMLRTWRSERDRYPGKVPVVAIGTDSYEHRIHRSRVKVPVFDLVGWEPWDEDVPEPVKPDPAGKFAEVLSDEIPF
jgi:hypothetical protein